MYSFPSFVYRENDIHNELKDHHINGEWFEYNDIVKKYIKKYKKLRSKGEDNAYDNGGYPNQGGSD